MFRLAQRERDDECECETDSSVCERQGGIVERGCNGVSESEVMGRRRDGEWSSRARQCVRGFEGASGFEGCM